MSRKNPGRSHLNSVERILRSLACAGAILLALPAAADPIFIPSPVINPIPTPYGPGFDTGVVIGPRDGCRTVVDCSPGNFANRPAHRRHYDNYFDVPTPTYSGQRRLDGNPSMSGPSRIGLPAGHVEWCSDRYRTYRISDDTFQPVEGGRKPCISPF